MGAFEWSMMLKSTIAPCGSSILCDVTYAKNFNSRFNNKEKAGIVRLVSN